MFHFIRLSISESFQKAPECWLSAAELSPPGQAQAGGSTKQRRYKEHRASETESGETDEMGWDASSGLHDGDPWVRMSGTRRQYSSSERFWTPARGARGVISVSVVSGPDPVQDLPSALSRTGRRRRGTGNSPESAFSASLDTGLWLVPWPRSPGTVLSLVETSPGSTQRRHRTVVTWPGLRHVGLDHSRAVQTNEIRSWDFLKNRVKTRRNWAKIHLKGKHWFL